MLASGGRFSGRLALSIAIAVLASAHDVEGQVTRITGEPKRDGCTIPLTERLRLDPDAAQGPVPGWPRVAVVQSGMLFLASELEAGLRVYRRDGTPVFDWADSIGQLPVIRIVAGRTGELFLDGGQIGILVFGPAGDYRRQLSYVPSPLTNLVVVGDTVLAVVGGRRPLQAPDRAVHLYSAVTGAFIRGLGPIEDLRPGQLPGTVSVAVSGDSALWMIHPPNRASRWALDGSLINALRWDAGWMSFVDEGFSSVDAEDGHVLHDLWDDPARGLLWVLSVVDDPRAQNTLPPARGTETIPASFFDPSRLNRSKTSIISVLDTVNWDIVAHRSIDEAGYQFLTDGRVLIMVHESNGSTAVELLSFGLSCSTGGFSSN